MAGLSRSHFQRGFRFKIRSAKALKKFASSPFSHSNHADYANCAPFQSDSMPLHQLRIARHCATNQEMHFITCDAIYIKSYFLKKKNCPRYLTAPHRLHFICGSFKLQFTPSAAASIYQLHSSTTLLSIHCCIQDRDSS